MAHPTKYKPEKKSSEKPGTSPKTKKLKLIPYQGGQSAQGHPTEQIQFRC